MGNNIFQSLLKEHYLKFKNSFVNTSDKIFKDPITGKIIHSAEYGKYREATAKAFLRLLTPQNLGIGNGFLITSEGSTSTECDIVIYDKTNTPLIESDEKHRFFPIETVVGIGEVKSTLNKTEFTEALNKLAMVKRLRTEASSNAGFIRRDHSLSGIPYDPKKYQLDQIFSFLICKKFSFSILDVVQELGNNIYKEDIDLIDRHNVILSIEDGLLSYMTLVLKEGVIYATSSSYPEIDQKPTTNMVTAINDDQCLNLFSSYFYNRLLDRTILRFDLAKYVNNELPII